MKPEPGLHKKVSSIFDGVTIPGQPSDSPRNPSDSGPNQDPINHSDVAAAQPSSTVPTQTSSNSVSSFSKETEIAKTTAETALPNTRVNETIGKENTTQKGPGESIQRKNRTIRKETTWSKFAKRVGIGISDPEEARQKKMAALVSFLAVVFVSVLFFTLRSPKSTQAAIQTQDEENMPSTTSMEIEWTRPTALPTDLRDPMMFNIAQSMANQTEEQIIDTQLFDVTGIVQGESGNTAIVSNKIVAAGDMILGARVLKINPDSVEFEIEGQKWTQPLRK
ncbi:MAG: hypothetical protein JXA82_12690 [Sedimentisphaerales bacterium]|nr:hypothetical protein [Sedimentisphaerales bacterium]